MSLITDSALAFPLGLEDAEALIVRLQYKIGAAKQEAEAAKRDAEIVPGGLYLDQHGTAYLAVDNAPYAEGQVRLWRLRLEGALAATPDWWRSNEGVDFRPATSGVTGQAVLMADGTEVYR